MSDIVTANINGAHKSRLKILGLNKDATKEDVKAKYDELCKLFSPSLIKNQGLSNLELEVREKIFVEMTEVKNLLKTTSDIYTQAVNETLHSRKLTDKFQSNVEKYAFYFEKLCVDTTDPRSFCDYYDVLGVKPDASSKELREAYIKIATSIHPLLPENADMDKSFTEAIYNAVTKVYERLENQNDRAKFDKEYAKRNGLSTEIFFDFYVSQRADYPSKMAELAGRKETLNENDPYIGEKKRVGNLVYYEFTMPENDDDITNLDEQETVHKVKIDTTEKEISSITLNKNSIKSIAKKGCALAKTIGGTISEKMVEKDFSRQQQNKLGLHEKRIPSTGEIIKNVGKNDIILLRVEPVVTTMGYKELMKKTGVDGTTLKKYISNDKYLSKGLMLVPYHVAYSDLKSNLKLARVDEEASKNPKAEINRLADIYGTIPEQIIKLNKDYISTSTKEDGTTTYSFTSDRVIVPTRPIEKSKTAKSKVIK